MLRLILVAGITIAGTLVAVPEVLAQRLVPRVTINDVSIIEGSAPTRTRVEFDVTLTVASDRSVSIDYATADGTATATGDRESADYVETSGTLTVPAGSTSQKVFVSILVDDRVEPNETFVVNLTDARNAVLSDAQGVGTIIDDDGPDSPRGPELAISDVSVREGDGPAVDAETASATFEVTLSAPVAHPVTVDYFTADGTATALSNTAAIEIPATGEEGLASRYPSTISVPATSGVLTDVNVTLTGLTHPEEQDLDVLLEGPDGTTVVLLSDWSAFFCSFADADLTFDDSWPPLRDSCQSGNYAPTNHGRGVDTFPFPAPQGTPGTALSWFNGTNPTGNWNLYIVDDEDDFFSGDVGQLSGWSLTLTTNSGVLGDYHLTAGTMTFPAGSTADTVKVDVTGDHAPEANEAFQVILVNPLNARIRDAQGIAAIVDDDGADPLAPRIAINDVAIVEGSSSATFEVTLSAASSQQVSVDYVTIDGTATAEGNVAAWSSAVEIEIPVTGEEGLASRYPSTIIVPATSGVLTDVNVTLTGLTHPEEQDLDVLLEGPDGTTVVLLSDWSAFFCSFADADLTFDDSWPPLRDSCQSGNYAPTNHGRGVDTFPFPAPQGTPGTALSWFNGTNPTGNWNLYIVDDEDDFFSGDVGQLSGWSLTLTTSGEGDYGATSGTLTFSAGTTRQTVAVDITPDVAIESTETFRLNLLGASSNVLIGDAWAVGRIFDDDETDNEPNSAPLAVGTLPGRRLRVNETVVVGLAAAFRDPDDDLLAYRASSSAIGVVSVNVSEGLLTVNPLADGAATIMVTATDVGGSNQSAAQQFAVTVGEGSGPEWLDDYRDTWRVLGGAPDGGAASVPPRGRVENGAFTADRIRPGTTPLKVVHFHELRARIAALRAREGLPAVQWTDPTLVAGVTPVKRVHLMELRTALDVVYDAVGRPRLSYTDAAVVAGTTAIRAVHLMELRTGVAALE